jgi:hypothetical protein
MAISHLAKLVSLQLLAVAFVSDAHATYPAPAEGRRDTVYLPTCWSDETQPQWWDCAVPPRRPGFRDWDDQR